MSEGLEGFREGVAQGVRDAALSARELACIDRSAVRGAVGRVLFNVMNYPPRVQALMLGQSTSGLTEKVTEAVMEAIAVPQGVRDEAALIQGLADDLYEADTLAGVNGVDEEGALDIARMLFARGWRR